MPENEALIPLIELFIRKDPVEVARALETMPEDDALVILKSLPAEDVAETFPHLHVTYCAEFLSSSETDTIRTVIKNAESKHLAGILLTLNEDERARLLAQMPARRKSEVREHLTYPEDSVGRFMSTRFIRLDKGMRVRDAIRKIRTWARHRQQASYVYVLDGEERLVGVVNMHSLLLAEPDDPIESVMREEVFALNTFTDLEEAAAELSKRRYFAAPVVDNEGHMLGIMKAESLIESVEREATEDLQKMFGAGGDERAFSTIGFSLKKRLPWLHVNLATVFLAAAVVGMFEDLIGRVTALAVFLPVVAGQGGNAGAQSLAIVMRGLVMREVPRAKVWRLLGKEAVLGLVAGVVTGSLTALAAWLWNGNPYLGVVIGLGMLVSLVVATASGAAIPLIMRALHLDPAQCSNIILTTVTDVVGFTAFLGFAMLFQNQLV